MTSCSDVSTKTCADDVVADVADDMAAYVAMAWQWILAWPQDIQMMHDPFVPNISNSKLVNQVVSQQAEQNRQAQVMKEREAILVNNSSTTFCVKPQLSVRVNPFIVCLIRTSL